MKTHLIRFILVIASAAMYITISAQEPDLSVLHNDKYKINAWINYCESLRLNSGNIKNNYVVLQQAATKGLSMVKDGDPENRSKFFMYTALGYYYQLKF